MNPFLTESPKSGSDTPSRIPTEYGTVIRTRNHPSNNARVYERRDEFWWETGDEVPLLPEQVQHVVDIYDFDIIYRP